MKKIVSLKEVMIIIISVALVTIATSTFAANIVLDSNSGSSTIGANEYQNAQTVPQDTNYINQSNNLANNNASNNNTSNNNTLSNNTARTYNTNNTDLPQTGIEDYNLGILLVIFIASAIFAYKKVQDYKNI